MTISAVDQTSTQPGAGRSMSWLFAAMALHSTGAAGTMTAGALISTELAGPGLSGLPNAATVLGTAAGALAIGSLMARSGRRFGLLATYVAGTAGALLAFAGALGRALPLLVGGMLLLGLGLGGAQLSRYVAAELYPASRKGFALSAITWSATFGAVFGPALIAPAASMATWQGWPGLAGPFALAALAMAGALVATTLLPDTLAATAGPIRRGRRIIEVRAAFRRPTIRLSIVAMTATYVAMLLLMLMTPVQLDHHGQGLGVVGYILSAHMIGMFALAPLSGWITDRLGGPATITTGVILVIAAATLSALLSTAHTIGLPLALFLLGYGWNLAFVGGSSVLSRELPQQTRIQLQGLIDAITWTSAAIISLTAGPLFAIGGYPLLALIAVLLAVVPLTLMLHRPRRGEVDRSLGEEPPSVQPIRIHHRSEDLAA